MDLLGLTGFGGSLDGNQGAHIGQAFLAIRLG
jgi:hypothetical protein